MAMRIGLLTDIHANREALDAVLAAAAADAVDRIVLLGDLVGYGPDPEYVVERCARLAEEGAICIKGNHDEAAIVATYPMSENARAAMDWTRKRLGTDHARFLAGLPMQQSEDDRLYVHASADRPEKWHYVNSIAAAASCLAATAASHVFCGHTHKPAHFYSLNGRTPSVFVPIANVALPLSPIRRSVTVVGAVGQPRDGNAAACYGLLDLGERGITMRRVPYDSEATLSKIKAAGLPAWLGMRLQVGR